jgi:hypothetical protein
MKKTLTLVTLLAGAVSGYSQGQLVFTDYAGTADMQIQVFNTQATAPTGATQVTVTYGGYTVVEYQGNPAAPASPAGTVVYNAGTALSGTGFDAQVYYSATAGDTLADLTPVTGVLHFSTGTTSPVGFIKGTDTDTLVALGTDSTGTIAIAAWSTDGGLYTTLAAAQLADKTTPNSAPWGFSSLAAITPQNPPVPIPSSLESFSLGAVPEPSTIALGVMGASALLFRRRK